MIALVGRLRARREAPLHVQLELLPFSAQPLRLDREVSIEGRVVETFRGRDLAKPGDHLSFDLWVCDRRDGPDGPSFVHYKRLMEATHLEAYLYGRPPRCQLAAHEFRLLRERSATPTMSVEELEIATGSMGQPGRWWEFWKR
jgi:hypothetical protein